jgi:DNA-binding GntR family transcriptional regulator
MTDEQYPFRPDVPRHRQIADVLRARIEAGELAPRFPIPSESQLQQEFGVARDTARKAVQILRDEGLVRTVVGMGTFVAEQDEASGD